MRLTVGHSLTRCHATGPRQVFKLRGKFFSPEAILTGWRRLSPLHAKSFWLIAIFIWWNSFINEIRGFSTFNDKNKQETKQFDFFAKLFDNLFTVRFFMGRENKGTMAWRDLSMILVELYVSIGNFKGAGCSRRAEQTCPPEFSNSSIPISSLKNSIVLF